MGKGETREVFLPAKVLELCLEDWDDAGDDALSQAVGETMEHAFLHLRWLLAIREFRCRLVVVQLKNPQGAELNPHYQLGDLITLSGWHPERALEEARELIAESGDGLTFDLPVDDEMLKDWAELAETLGIEAPESRDDPNELELLASAMVLLDAAHDDYVDSATQAIRLLKDMNWLDINPEPPDNDDDYLEFTQPKRVNPYSA
jgi:hypothetical protein